MPHPPRPRALGILIWCFAHGAWAQGSPPAAEVSPAPAASEEEAGEAVEISPDDTDEAEGAVEATEAGGDDDVITVIGTRQTGPLPASTDAVDVIDTAAARGEAGDMGALLDRAQGVTLRRSGGLGARSTFYIHGLSEKRVRIYVDGVPTNSTGLNLNPSDIPVHLIERVEIYKGVVPIRFGGDALGGAVNFVTRDGGLSGYMETSTELASFGTFRGSTVSRVVLSEDKGLFADFDAFFDRSDNDYEVEVQIPDERGRPHTEKVRRFHDKYQAYGITARVGLMEQGWADRLTLGAFVTHTDKDLQHNVTMSVPYGDITRGEDRKGLSVQYRRTPRSGSPWGAELLASFADIDQRLDDVSYNLWSWRGEITRQRPNPGERTRGERLRGEGNHAAARLTLSWLPHAQHRLEVSATADRSEVTRRFIPTGPNRTAIQEEEYGLLKVIDGASWQVKLFGARLENDAFFKHYYASPEGPPNGSGVGSEPQGESRHAFGGGDSLRLTVWPGLYAKASYEYAIRLPDPRELFGDGALLERSPGLKNEVSHNANLGVILDPVDTFLGAWGGSAHGFWRGTRDLIFLVPTLDSARYQNVADVKTYGVEAGATWTGWGLLTLSANGTWLRSTNESTNGQFGKFKGDRMPNLPYMFGYVGASLHQSLPEWGLDRGRLYWHSRYVHEYFLFWESQGLRSTKLKVPTQVVHDFGLNLTGGQGRVTSSFEVHNAFDEKRFDSVGVQLAGRSFHLKVGVSFE